MKKLLIVLFAVGVVVPAGSGIALLGDLTPDGFLLLNGPGQIKSEKRAALPNAASPNVVFILADDLGIGDVGIYNSQSKIPTPHINELAEEGMRFTDAHASGSWCTPSRYGLMTGRYPFRGEMRDWNERALLETGQVTLPSLLRENGYHTGMVGKWHLGFEGGTSFDCSEPLQGGPVDHGFDYFFGMHTSLDIPPYFFIEGNECVAAPTETIYGRRSSKSFWNDIQGPFWREGDIAPGFHHEDVLSRWREKGVAFLEKHSRERSGQPFFLYLALSAPHTPWLPLQQFRGKSGAGMYGDFTMQVDAVVGDVLQALERLDMAKNTLVVFTSDNGPVWYSKDEKRFDHQSADVYRGMKGDAWEGGHRMPFVARWPGHVSAGAVSEETVGFTDMLATIAALLEKELPAEAGPDSRSFLPVLLGENQEAPVRETLVHSGLIGSKRVAIRQGPWKLIPWRGSGGFTEPRRRDPESGEAPGQLYNLADDPGESKNMYEQRPDVVDRLSALLENYRGSLGASTDSSTH